MFNISIKTYLSKSPKSHIYNPNEIKFPMKQADLSHNGVFTLKMPFTCWQSMYHHSAARFSEETENDSYRTFQ